MKCGLCNAAEEDTQHLFCECSFSSELILLLGRLLDITGCSPRYGPWQRWIKCISRCKSGTTKFWNAGFEAVLYAVCGEAIAEFMEESGALMKRCLQNQSQSCLSKLRSVISLILPLSLLNFCRV